MSMFWNPVTGTYQRCCPALSPVKRQPLVLKSQPQDGIQVAKRQPLKQPLVQPRSVARDQPRKQPQDVAKNVDQPLNSGMKRQPPIAVQGQRQSADERQPPKVVMQPPKRPQDAAKSSKSQPLNGTQSQPLKVVQPQVRPRAQPHVAQPPNTVQPQMPDLPPDPDPSKCKKVRMPITTGYTSYPQWGKAAPSLRIYKFYNLNETKVKG